MGLRVLIVLFGALVLAGAARADELSDLNELILQDPQNVELNLRYARVAEQKGDWRKALSAYERITVNNPENQEAQVGFRRVSRRLQPDVTRVTAEMGTGWESNPARLADGGASDWLVMLRGDVKDERRLGDVHWRTNASAAGEFYRTQGSDLDYASVTGLTGPMTDLTPQLALHSGLGLGAAQYAGHTLYQEALTGFTLESGFWNGTQTGRLRFGFRRYGDFFGGSEGVYADLSERLGFSEVFYKNDIVVAMPWFRWSGIEGTPLNIPMEETQPGRYWELGLRGEYLRPIYDWLMIGGSLSISHRRYADVTILDDGSAVLRRDWQIIPALTAIFPNLFRKATDLRLDYKFEKNNSNVDFDSYHDHQITTSVVFRF
jgi:hypothetical protein